MTTEEKLDVTERATTSSIAARASHGHRLLPDKPLIRIRPSRKWVALNLGDLWAYRELLFFLTWRDVKVRYKQTLLGAAWAVIQPLLTTIIFTLFFGRLAGIPSVETRNPPAMVILRGTGRAVLTGAIDRF